MKVETNGNTIQIHMTRDEAHTCSHQGSCDADVADMRKKHPRLMARVRRDVLIAALIEYGAWTLSDLNKKTDDDLRETALWVAAGDIVEDKECQGWAFLDGSYYMAHPEQLKEC